MQHCDRAAEQRETAGHLSYEVELLPEEVGGQNGGDDDAEGSQRGHQGGRDEGVRGKVGGLAWGDILVDTSKNQDVL